MEGFRKKLRVFSLGNINVWATAIFFVSAVIGFAINLTVAKTPYLATGNVAGDIGLSVGLILVGLIAHEGIHALSAIIVGKCKKSDVSFGVKFKEGILYCHCEKPMKGGAYCVMLVMPLIVTGLIPYAVCVAAGGLLQIAVFAFMISGAAGDIVMLAGMLKNKDYKRMIKDHPKATAYFVLYDETSLPADFTETTEEEENELIEQAKAKDGKKLGISILLIAIFISLTVLGLFLIGLFMKIV